MSPDDEKARRKQALAVAALLLLQERRAKRLLRNAVRWPLTLLTLGGSHRDVEYVMRQHGRRSIIALRAQARDEARKGWKKTTREPLVQVYRAHVDEAKATSAAESLSRQWAKAHRDAVEAQAADPAEQASVDIEYAVDRTATTETVDAFNDETEAMASEAAASGLVVTQTWEGILDTRTCPECEAVEGQTVVRPERFYELPPLHPGCRCFLSTWITESAAVAA